MFIQVIEGRTSDPAAGPGQSQRGQRALQPVARGSRGAAGGAPADGMCVLVARFEDRESAQRNSDRPEQGAWWSETEQCFDGPVTFHDSEDVHVMQHGRLEDAHFVQVMEGHVTDRARAEELERESAPVLAELRPDLLGSFTAYFDDGEYADVAFFTSESEAREGERQEMPPEFAEKFGEWEQVMKVDRYLDLQQPWLSSAGSSA